MPSSRATRWSPETGASVTSRVPTRHNPINSISKTSAMQISNSWVDQPLSNTHSASRNCCWGYLKSRSNMLSMNVKTRSPLQGCQQAGLDHLPFQYTVYALEWPTVYCGYQSIAGIVNNPSHHRLTHQGHASAGSSISAQALTNIGKPVPG